MDQSEIQRHSINDVPTAGHRAGFWRSEDGSFVIFGLMVFLLMLIAGGIGVDLMRFETQRTRLQATQDRAVLAAASMGQPLDPTTVVLDYFEKAGLGAYIDADDVTVTDTLTSRRVEASAKMTVSTTLLRFAGIEGFVAPAMATAEESASQTEISLVLDTSGSMGWSSASGASKISELRTAAKQFINIVLCDPANPNRTSPCVVEPGKVSVSIVPYSEQVLVGETLLDYFTPTTEHHSSSCVTFDGGDFSRTSITPTETLRRTGHFDPWTSSSSSSARSWSCKTDSWREITAVNGDAATLRSAIDALGASGNTSIDLGMKWGSAFLDPAAQPVVADLITAGDTDEDYEDRPLNWEERGVEKVIVLMTDGVNTRQHYLYNNFRSGDSPIYRNLYECGLEEPCLGDKYSIYDEDNDRYYWEDNRSWEDHAYGAGTYQRCTYRWVRQNRRWVKIETCNEITEGSGARQLNYVELWETKPWSWWNKWSWLDEPGDDFGNSTKNSRLDVVCDAAKDEDIPVFAVGFEVTSSSATVMRNCASSNAHYFNATGLNLSQAFAAIAREISKLRLTN